MEEETRPGKRLAEREPLSPAAKRGLIVVIAVVAALCAAYVALCAWASGDRILPRVSVAGRNVGGMDLSSAAAALADLGSAPYEGNVLTLTYGGRTLDLSGRILEADPQASATAAMEYGRSHSVLARGAYALKALLAGAEVKPVAAFSAAGQAEAEAAMDRIAQELGGDLRETTWTVREDQLVFRIGNPGTGVDRTALREQILDLLGDQGGSHAVETVSTDPAGVDLTAIHAQLYTEARDAALDRETFEVTDSVVGVDFDIDAAKTILEGAGWGSVVSVPLTLTQPQVSGESLNALLFRDVLGEATAVSPGNSAQLNNIGLASAACDGTILMPGEVFSYNKATGSRTADDGYQSATVYKDGKTVVEVGGGVCFPSSTIYWAALNSNLKIVTRQCHQFAVGYVPDGMDATVYDPVVDFQFENDTEYPIKVSAKFKDRTLVVQMLGTKTDDVTVKMTNQVYDWISYETKYEVNPDLPAGTPPKEVQNGYNGRKATTYRNLYDKDGNLISSTLEANSRYNVRPRILQVSPADAAQYGLAPDGTPLPEESAAPTPPPTGEDPGAGQPPAVSEPPVTEPPAAEPTPTPEQPEPTPTPEQPEPTPPIGTEPTPEPSPAPTEDPEAPPAGIPIE